MTDLSIPTDEQMAQLQAWRAQALEEMPYFARIQFSLRVLNAPGLGTWAVDEHYRMYVDFDAVAANHSFRWNVESVLHESSHLFADHATSARELGITAQTAKVWNAAADLSINDDLDEVGCKTFGDDKMLPAFIGEENGQTPHYYYGVLAQKMQQAQQKQPKCGTCGQPKSGQKQPQPGPQPSGQQGQQGQQGNQPQQPNGMPQPATGQGQKGGGNGGQCSQPGGVNGQSGQGGSGGQGQQPGSAGSGQCSECGQGSAQGGQGGDQQGPFKGCGSGSGGEAWSGQLGPDDDFGGYAPAAGAIEKEAIRLATAAAIKDHVAKGRGTAPGGLVAIADKVLEPSKTPWQKLLAGAIKSAVAKKAGSAQIDQNRRNRRRHAETIMTSTGRRRVVLPGYFKPTPRLVLIRDTSGSMGAYDLAMANREVESIARKMGIKGDDLMVMDVDADVQQVQSFKNRKGLAKVVGRGGTSMTVGIRKVWESKDLPSAIVVLTDGGTDWPTEPGPVPVVAAIVPQHSGEHAEQWADRVPDFIKTVVVDPAEPVAKAS